MASKVQGQRDVLLLLVDVSGYTHFMVAHSKELSHGQMIISRLLDAIVDQIQPPLAVAKLEGDAVFVYAVMDEGDPEWADACGELERRLLDLFQEFAWKREELAVTAICECDSCSGIDDLRVKVVAHGGEAVFHEFGDSIELAGVDVILAHRLMKNSVKSDQYLLMTPSAHEALSFGSTIHGELTETYEGLGETETYVHYPEVRGLTPEQELSDGDAFAAEILRHEIRSEYAHVATNPDEDFHFHTGRKLASILGYEPEWLEGLPAESVAAMAGTGNPLSMGMPEEGWNVVDVGSGSGADSLIAARAVGPRGSVVGVEMTAEMLVRAEAAAAEMGLTNVTFVEGLAETLPVEDGWADVLISNGVLNLCADKDLPVSEFFRVLRSGGRLQIADIVVQRPVSEAARRNIDLWTG